MGLGTIMSKTIIIEKFLEENLTLFKQYRSIDEQGIENVMRLVRREERKKYQDEIKTKIANEKMRETEKRKKLKDERTVIYGIKQQKKRSEKPAAKKKKEVKKIMS